MSQPRKGSRWGGAVEEEKLVGKRQEKPSTVPELKLGKAPPATKPVKAKAPPAAKPVDAKAAKAPTAMELMQKLQKLNEEVLAAKQEREAVEQREKQALLTARNNAEQLALERKRVLGEKQGVDDALLTARKDLESERQLREQFRKKAEAEAQEKKRLDELRRKAEEELKAKEDKMWRIRDENRQLGREAGKLTARINQEKEVDEDQEIQRLEKEVETGDALQRCEEGLAASAEATAAYAKTVNELRAKIAAIYDQQAIDSRRADKLWGEEVSKANTSCVQKEQAVCEEARQQFAAVAKDAVEELQRRLEVEKKEGEKEHSALMEEIAKRREERTALESMLQQTKEELAETKARHTAEIAAAKEQSVASCPEVDRSALQRLTDDNLEMAAVVEQLKTELVEAKQQAGGEAGALEKLTAENKEMAATVQQLTSERDQLQNETKTQLGAKDLELAEYQRRAEQQVREYEAKIEQLQKAEPNCTDKLKTLAAEHDAALQRLKKEMETTINTKQTQIAKAKADATAVVEKITLQKSPSVVPIAAPIFKPAPTWSEVPGRAPGIRIPKMDFAKIDDKSVLWTWLDYAY